MWSRMAFPRLGMGSAPRVGLGVGLMVVRELVAAHGGTVVAQSAGTGLGSQLVVTLPMREAAT